MPLTTIIAWEALFDKLGLERDATGTLLVLGAAGGVGSMVVQLARRLTGLTVIATASRPESIAWARDMGAHHVVDHHRLIAEVRRVAPGGVDDVFTRFDRQRRRLRRGAQGARRGRGHRRSRGPRPARPQGQEHHLALGVRL